MTKAGNEILEGMQDGLDYLQGDKSKGRANRIIASSIDVKAIRKKTGLNQQDFADTFGFPIDTLRKWEGGSREPRGAAKAYFHVISKDPSYVQSALNGA